METAEIFDFKRRSMNEDQTMVDRRKHRDRNPGRAVARTEGFCRDLGGDGWPQNDWIGWATDSWSRVTRRADIPVELASSWRRTDRYAPSGRGKKATNRAGPGPCDLWVRKVPPVRSLHGRKGVCLNRPRPWVAPGAADTNAGMDLKLERLLVRQAAIPSAMAAQPQPREKGRLAEASVVRGMEPGDAKKACPDVSGCASQPAAGHQ
jgi:hypothetical protein